MIKVFIFLSLFYPSFWIDGCGQFGTNPFTEAGLITNPSFEIFGQPSQKSWTDGGAIVQDAPRGGGRWCLEMEATWFPAVNVSTTIPAPFGLHQYKFSVWGKYHGVIHGTARLMIKRADSMDFRTSIGVTDTVWTYYTAVDTIRANPGDSLVVQLTGGASELLGGKTFFDLCELEEIR